MYGACSRFCVFVFLLFSQLALADLRGFFPETGGPLTVEPVGAPVAASGLDFAATQGSILAGDSSAPFAFFLSRGPERVTLGSLGAPAIIDGALTLDVTVSADAVIDGSWGDGPVPRPLPVSAGGGNGFAARSMSGSYPYDGGPITLRPKFDTASVTGISIAAQSGSLSSSGNPAPFETIGDNTAQLWSASSSAAVLFDGEITLDVRASGGATFDATVSDAEGFNPLPITRLAPEPTDALVASLPFSGGAVSLKSTNGPVTTRGIELFEDSSRIPLPINFVGGGSPAPYSSLDENSATRWAASSDADVIIDGIVTLDVTAEGWPAGLGANMFDGTATTSLSIQRRNASLSASVPFQGGPITVTGNNTVTRSLRFDASLGSLSSSGNSAPYDTLDANTATTWAASSAADVIIDGAVTLDVVASVGAVVEGTLNDGFTDIGFDVGRSRPPLSNNLRGSFPNEGGPITLATLAPTRVNRLQLDDKSSGLSQGASPAPFETVVKNSADQWIVASSTDIVLDGAVTLDVHASSNSSVTGNYVNDANDAFQFSVTQGFGDPDGGLVGTFPAGGGNITVTTTDGPLETRGLEFIATAGSLSQGSSSAPYAFFVTNSNQPASNVSQVTMGSLSDVTLDGAITLDVTASADAVLESIFGLGPVPIPFATVVAGGDGGPIEGELHGSYLLEGGPISLFSRGGPVSVQNLDLEATKGTIAGGNNPAPFDQVTESSDTTWALSVDLPITIDGTVVLDAQAAANTFIKGTADGDVFKVNGLGSEELSADIVAIFDEAGGEISLLAPNGPVEMETMVLEAQTGEISIINADGSLFELSTDPAFVGRIALSASSGSITIDDPIAIGVFATGDAEISGSMSAPGTFAALSVPASTTTVPEPATNILVLLGGLSLLWFRKRSVLS